MTKIEAFKLEFYCCRVPIQPHRSRVYKTQVLKPKPSLRNSIFVGLEEKQNLKKNAAPKKTGWRSAAPRRRSNVGWAIWLEKNAGGQFDLK